MVDLTLSQLSSLSATLHPIVPCRVQMTASTPDEQRTVDALGTLLEHAEALIRMARECLALRGEVETASRDLCSCFDSPDDAVNGRPLSQIVEAVIARVDGLEAEVERVRGEEHIATIKQCAGECERGFVVDDGQEFEMRDLEHPQPNIPRDKARGSK